TEYPSQETYESSFSMSLQPVSFGVPEALSSIDPGLAANAESNSIQSVRDTASEIRDQLRAEFLRVQGKLIVSLSPNEEGKKKRLYETALGDLIEFLERWDAVNLTDDAELTAMVNQSRVFTRDIDTESLRVSDRIREYVKNGLEKVQETASATLRPKRLVSL